MVAPLLGLFVPACRAPESSPLDLVKGGPEGFVPRFLGNETFEDRRLLREAQQNLEEYVESDWPKYAVDDAAYALQVFYEGEGFRSAKVAYEIVSEGREEPLVIFLVEEGVRTELGPVEFDGNEEFDDDALRRLVAPEAGGLFGLFGSRQTWYSQSRLESARGRVEDLYYERGYLNAAVELREPVFSADGTSVSVLYQVAEGLKYGLHEVSITGIPQAWQEPAHESFEESLEEAWFPRVGFEIQAKVEEVAAERGHPDAAAKVDAAVDQGTGEVRLAVAVDPGPEVRIRDVHVQGNAKTATAFIISRLELSPGELYDRRKERESFRNLYETGIFDRVRLRLEGGTDTERDLVVEVEEGPSLEVYVEPGYGSYERFRIQTGVTERNLFGTGRRLSAEFAAAVLAQNAKLRFTEPNLFGPRTNVDLEGFAGRREEPSFTREEIGAAVQLRHRFTRKWSSTLRYERSVSRATNIQVMDPDAIQDEEDLNLSLISLTPAYDSRSAPFLPTHGTLGRFTVELSDPNIGSELGYVRLLGTGAHYFPFGLEAAIAVSFRTGVLLATDDTESFPIQLRFFNGGENTVRSFNESELGPKDENGEPIGGEVYNVFSIEARHNLVSRLQGAVFFDAGNVLESSSDYGSFEGISTAVGVGLRWVLPIGPVRLDLGVNPDPGEGEDSFVLHFSLGTAY